MLLPGLLLVAGGTAFAGMAVLPAAADDAPRTAPAVPVEAVAVPPAQANVHLLAALQKGAATAAVPARAPARASRKRAPAVAVKPAPPAFVRPGTGGLTSPYGQRWGRLHGGIDLAAGMGAPIKAVTRGTVVSAGTEGGYGRVVRLQHADATVTVYAHLSEILVEKGQAVPTGHVIGREGNSGHSTGPHLHFEVRVGGRPVDPRPWLRARGIGV